MKKYIVSIAIIYLASLCMTSCVGRGGYSFQVENNTGSTVKVYTKSLPANYSAPVIESLYDSIPITNELLDKADTIFKIPSHARFNTSVYWDVYWDTDDLHATPEQNGVTPLWKLIREIRVGDKIMPAESWNNIMLWEITYSDESYREYCLNIRDTI